MTFRQYAGFAIKNAILCGLGNELRTVRMCRYAREKAQERGETLFNSVSLEVRSVNKHVTAIHTPNSFENGNIYEYLYSRLEERFSERDCIIFYKSFGLKGYSDQRNHELALEYGKSDATISQTIKKIIRFIRQDGELMEAMQDLATSQTNLEVHDYTKFTPYGETPTELI